nr:SGNH/GDSL hydrolase family protein [Brucella intermedia]
MLGPSGWDHGSGTTPYEAFVESMWPRQARQLGLKQPLEVVNRGVGGQAVSGMDFAADLAGGMQLMLIKYGINDATVSPDPSVALKTFAEALDAKLTAARNSPNGDIYNLSIVLVGASSTYDPASDRDASWFERLRGVYEAAARKHRCFYFDTYGYMQDSRWAIGAWLDDAGLHPEAVGYWWIFGHLFHVIFQPNELEYWRRNHLTNTSGAFDVPQPLWNLNTEYFNYGASLKYARLSEGFPDTGGLLTLFQADRAGMQMLFPINSRGVIHARTYNPAEGVASFGSVWTGDPKGIAFTNGWQEFDTVNYGTSYCIRTIDGLVHARLCIRGGTALTAGAVIGVLPDGFRPSSIEQFSCFNLAGAAGRIDVTTAGNIRIVGGVTADMLNASFAFRAN